MNMILYKIKQGVREDDTPILKNISLPYSESNLGIARMEAYSGEYVIEDNGQSEPVSPESDTATWDELAAAIAEGVDDV